MTISGYSDDVFRPDIQEARAILQAGVDKQQEGAPLKIGAGFLGWLLDEPGGKVAGLLNIALEERVIAIWLAFGKDLGKWVDVIRRYDEARKVLHKTLVIICVNSVEEAKVAVEDWKADIIVAQGTINKTLMND